MVKRMTGSARTCLIGVNQLQLMDQCQWNFLWTAVFPRVPAWVHCCSLFTPLPSLRSLNVTFRKLTSTPMTPNSSSALGQVMMLPRMPCIALWKYALRTFKSGWLILNDTKTEFLGIETRQQLSKLCSSSIEVGNQKTGCSSSDRNLGIMLDKSVGMNSHINQMCKASLYHIHNIRRISKYLFKECRQSLVHAYVTSRLVYCNSILYGLPKCQLSKLQRIQNMVARLITDTLKFDHINPVLFNLHWLPVNYLYWIQDLDDYF